MNLREKHFYFMAWRVTFVVVLSLLFFLGIIHHDITGKTAWAVPIVLSCFCFLWFCVPEKIIELDKKYTVLIRVILLAVLPFVIFFAEEVSWNEEIHSMKLKPILVGYVMYLCIECFFYYIIPNRAIALQMYGIIMSVIGIVNSYILEFRGTPLSPVDLHALSTASEVASSYAIRFSNQRAICVMIIILFFVGISLLAKLGIIPSNMDLKVYRMRAVIAVVLCFFSVFSYMNISLESVLGKASYWSDDEYTDYGYFSGFLINAQNSRVVKADSYQREEVEKMLSSYEEDTSSGKKPTIIMVMNEAYSDLSVLGQMDYIEENMPFYYSLKKDRRTIEWGSMYASVKGGRTANTEFECLTGFSLANLSDSIPYVLYDFSNVGSMASVLKDQGYQTYGMHPMWAQNWNRDIVYKDLGFDEFYDIDDYEGYEKNSLERISDAADYQMLEDLFERNKNKGPQFLFNVTIQNHGGYDEDVSRDGPAAVMDEDYSEYQDVANYLALIRQSDEAIKQLISYFESVDEPVILCVFGDHQPALAEDFFDEILKTGKTKTDTSVSLEEKKYASAYFIWANYDIEKNLSFSYDGRNVTSANYLGAQVLSYAGVKTSAFQNYLLQMRKEYPVINSVAALNKNGTWIASKNEEYRDIQYNGLFDKKRNKKLFGVSE